MSREPLALAQLHEKLKSFDVQTRAVGAGELALVALAFSDLTSTIASEIVWRWLIGLFVTATLLAGLATALTWIYTHAALNLLNAPTQPLTKADAAKIQSQYLMARVMGWSSIVLVLLAGAAYMTTVWKWVCLDG